MNIDVMLIPPALALLAGLAILIWPRLLSYIVAAALIVRSARCVRSQGFQPWNHQARMA